MVEVWALRDGLVFEKAENVRNLEIEMDALGVLQLLNDKHMTNHPLDNILLDCRSIMEAFEAVSTKHVYHETNHCANALAHDAPISVKDLYIYPCIPNCIANLLYAI